MLMLARSAAAGAKRFFMLALLGAANAQCPGWCNAYTCGISSCTGCSTCTDLAAGNYCASWCNRYTCGQSFCSGCDVCYVPYALPQGKWSYEMRPNTGVLAGTTTTNFLTSVNWQYFKFEIEINGDNFTSYTWIDWFGAGIQGPFTSIDQNTHYYGTKSVGGHGSAADPGMLSNYFHVAIPNKAPGAFPDLSTGLHLCYDDFDNVQNHYAIEDAYFSWKYLPATDEWQYATIPVFYCPSTPLDDNNLKGGVGPWANTNPVMVDPFVKSFYIMMGKVLPKMQRSTS